MAVCYAAQVASVFIVNLNGVIIIRRHSAAAQLTSSSIMIGYHELLYVLPNKAKQYDVSSWRSSISVGLFAFWHIWYICSIVHHTRPKIS